MLFPCYFYVIFMFNRSFVRCRLLSRPHCERRRRIQKQSLYHQWYACMRWFPSPFLKLVLEIFHASFCDEATMPCSLCQLLTDRLVVLFSSIYYTLQATSRAAGCTAEAKSTITTATPLKESLRMVRSSVARVGIISKTARLMRVVGHRATDTVQVSILSL